MCSYAMNAGCEQSVNAAYIIENRLGSRVLSDATRNRSSARDRSPVSLARTRTPVLEAEAKHERGMTSAVSAGSCSRCSCRCTSTSTSGGGRGAAEAEAEDTVL